MSDPTTDPITLRDLAAGAAALIAGLMAWIMKLQVARIDKIEAKLTPTSEEFLAHVQLARETFIKLFEGQDHIRKDIANLGSDMTATINAIHIETLKALAHKEDKHSTFYPLDK